MKLPHPIGRRYSHQKASCKGCLLGLAAITSILMSACSADNSLKTHGMPAAHAHTHASPVSLRKTYVTLGHDCAALKEILRSGSDMRV